MRDSRLDSHMLFQAKFSNLLCQHLTLTGTSAPDDVEFNRLLFENLRQGFDDDVQALPIG